MRSTRFLVDSNKWKHVHDYDMMLANAIPKHLARNLNRPQHVNRSVYKQIKYCASDDQMGFCINNAIYVKKLNAPENYI